MTQNVNSLTSFVSPTPFNGVTVNYSAVYLNSSSTAPYGTPQIKINLYDSLGNILNFIETSSNAIISPYLTLNNGLYYINSSLYNFTNAQIIEQNNLRNLTNYNSPIINSTCGYSSSNGICYYNNTRQYSESSYIQNQSLINITLTTKLRLSASNPGVGNPVSLINSDDNFQVAIQMSNNLLSCQINVLNTSGTAVTAGTSSYTLVANEWTNVTCLFFQHTVGTYNYSMYINGSLHSTGSRNNIASFEKNATVIRLGAQKIANNRFLNGSLDDVLIIINNTVIANYTFENIVYSNIENSITQNFTIDSYQIRDGFEIGDYQTSQWSSKHFCPGCSHAITFPNNEITAREGSYVFKANFTEGDSISNVGGNRSEILTNPVEQNSTYSYGFSTYLPLGWQSDNSTMTSGKWFIFAQWHNTPDSSLGEMSPSPPLSLQVANNTWRISRLQTTTSCLSNITSNSNLIVNNTDLTNIFTDGSVGHWTDWVIQAKWSCDDGFLKVWKDGIIVLNVTGAINYNDSIGPYFKIGLYQGGSSVSTRVIYHDSIRIANSSASYSDVAPYGDKPLMPAVSNLTSYYFSSNVNYSGDGTLTYPLKYLYEVNYLSDLGYLNPGESVFLKRGDVWREIVNYTGTGSASGTSSSRINFTAYGSGTDKAWIYGSLNGSALSWSKSGNVWKTPSLSFNVSPNVIWRSTYANDVLHTPMQPIYLLNKTSLSSLTSNWDWFYNSTDKSVHVYLDTNNITNESFTNGLEIPFREQDTFDALMVINNKDYLTFNGLGFAYCLNECIYNQLGDYNEFINNSFVGSWGKTLVLNGDNTNPKSVKDNYVAYNDFYETGLQGLLKGAQGETIWIASMFNTTIQSNIIQNPHGVVINGFHTYDSLIENNSIFDCQADPGDYANALYGDGVNNSLTRYNYVNNCSVGYSINSEISGNYSYNNTAYNNVFDNIEVCAIFDCNLDNTCNIGVNFSQNTCRRSTQTNTGYYALIQAQNTTDLILTNNNYIVEYDDADPVIYHIFNNSLINYVSDYNNFYSLNSSYEKYSINNGAKIYTSLSTYQTGQNQDLHSRYGTPGVDSLLYPYSNSEICDISSLGSYVGALACLSASCEENWLCTSYNVVINSSCSGVYYERTCQDANSCGTYTTYPLLNKCVSESSGSSGGSSSSKKKSVLQNPKQVCGIFGCNFDKWLNDLFKNIEFRF